MNAVTESAFEAVAIEKRHEELEVFFFAVMRRCGHQQEVAREARQHLPKPITFRVLDFSAEKRRGEFVCFVADHEIPAAVRSRELCLNIFVAREFIETGNNEIVFEKPVTGSSSFQLVVREDLER